MPKTRRLSDATLVRRSQQGDRRAFSALLSRYDWRLRGLAHALLLDRGEMDAALALGYLRAWRDVVRINAKDDVAAWLYRVTYNACIDQMRRAPTSAEAPAAGPAGSAGLAGLAAGLATLPAAERVAVVLVDREGFPPAAAARILGVTSDALATTLDAARDHLIPHLPPAPVEQPAEPAPAVEPGDEVEPATAAEPGDEVEPAPAAEPGDEVEPGEAVEVPSSETPESGAVVATSPERTVHPNGNGQHPVPQGDNGDGATVEIGPQGTNGDGDGDGAGEGDSEGSAGDGFAPNRGRGRRARRRAKHATTRAPGDTTEPSGGTTL